MARLEFTPDQIDERIKVDPEMQQLATDDPTEFEVQHAKLYKAFGYNPDGSSMSVAKKTFGNISLATGIPEGVVQGVANVPIPLATTIAGGVAGSFAPGPGTALGASIGSVAGEEINYHLGLRDEPTAVDRGIAAAAPLIGPAVSRLKGPVSSLLQSLPGAGKTMNNLAHEALKKNLKYMEVSPDEVKFMRGLFESVPDFRTAVPMLRDSVKRELDEASRSLMPDSAYVKQLNELTKTLSANKTVSFKQLMATEHDFIKTGATASDEVWSKLSGVVVNDLEAQAKNPKLTQATRDKILQGVESFKNYVAVNKRYKGQATLTNFLESSTTRLDDGMIRFNKKAFLKQLEDERKLPSSPFEQTELDSIKKAITDLGFIGTVSKGMLEAGATHTGSLGMAGLAAYSVGGVSGVVAASIAIGGLRLALGSELGRRAVTHLAKKGHGTIQAVELKEMMGKIVAGINAGAVAGVSGAGSQTGVNPFQNQE